MKLAILVPTRNRPAGLLRLYDSIINTISGNHKIFFAYYIDNDDEKIIEYAQLKFKEHPSVRVIHYHGERKIIAKTWNEMAAKMTANGLYFMNGADDMTFDTPGWDDILFSRLLPHPYGLYYFDDGIQHEGLATFAVVSQHWIRRLGYFFPEHIIHNFLDTYIHDVARRAGTLVYIPQVRLVHHHFVVNKDLYDKTYQEAEQHFQEDGMAYYETAERRQQEAEIILSHIR